MGRSRTFKTGLLASGSFLTSCVGFLGAMALVRLLRREDFGVYAQAMLVYKTVGPMLALGLPTALYYFLPREPRRSRSILTNNLLLLTLLGASFSVFLLAGGGPLLTRMVKDPSPALPHTLYLMALYPLFVFPTRSVGAALMSADHYKQLAVFNVTSRALMLSVVVGACWVYRSPESAIVGHVVASAIVLVGALVLMVRACPNGPARASVPLIRSQLAYSLPIGVMACFDVLRVQIDKILVAGLFSAETYAVYQTGAMQIPVVGVISGAMTGVLLPDLTRLCRDDRKDEALSLWRRAAMKSALLIFPLTAFFFVMAPETMRVLFSSRYAASAEPFRVYTLLLPIRIVNLSLMFLAMGRSMVLTALHGSALVINLVLSLVLIRWMGPVGAAWGTVISMGLWVAPICLVWIARNYGSSVRRVLPFGRLLGIAAVSTVPAAAVFLLMGLLPDLGDVIRPGIFVVFPAAMAVVCDVMRLGIFFVMYAGLVVLCYDRLGWVPVRSWAHFVRGLRRRRPIAEQDKSKREPPDGSRDNR